jgi:phospholipase/carboxylesterase
MTILSLSRRALFALPLAIATTACSKPRRIDKRIHGGVDFELLVHKHENQEDARRPWIVAIHGIGGAPEHWVDGWMPFPNRANVALPRGFDRHEDGFSWFPWTPDMTSPKLAADVSSAADRLWTGIMALSSGKPVVLAGFSQGAILSYLLASRHAESVVHAFTVAGCCPVPLRPKEKTRLAPITAYHGTADDIIPLWEDQATKAAYEAAGGKVTLREYPGVRHTATDEMHRHLFADMLASGFEG